LLDKLKDLPLCHGSFRIVIQCRSGKLNNFGFGHLLKLSDAASRRSRPSASFVVIRQSHVAKLASPR
jgi:hypothetical protein